MKISEIKPNPHNPRFINDANFKKLVKSIKEFPEMLSVRPIVIDENNMVLGGNMRLKACIEAGYDDVPVMYSTGWSEEQKKEFIIKDNVGFGQWDWDMIANEWHDEPLEDWGLDLPVDFGFEESEESEKEKQPTIQIAFVDSEQKKEVEYEVKILLEKYKGAFIK